VRAWSGEGGRERERGLNHVGPTKRLSQFNRSDRLPRTVRPVWPKLTEILLSHGLWFKPRTNDPDYI
jgi:hypothetical protein